MLIKHDFQTTFDIELTKVKMNVTLDMNKQSIYYKCLQLPFYRQTRDRSQLNFSNGHRINTVPQHSK